MNPRARKSHRNHRMEAKAPYRDLQATQLAKRPPEALDYLDKTVLAIRTTVPSLKEIHPAAPKPIYRSAVKDEIVHAPAAKGMRSPKMRSANHVRQRRSGPSIALLAAMGAVIGMSLLFGAFRLLPTTQKHQIDSKVVSVLDGVKAKFSSVMSTFKKANPAKTRAKSGTIVKNTAKQRQRSKIASGEKAQKSPYGKFRKASRGARFSQQKRPSTAVR